MRVGGQHVPTNQTRLRNKKPRSRRKRALGSWRSCGFPDVAALRANGGIRGGLATTSDRPANRTKPTTQTMITSPNAAIGPSRGAGTGEPRGPPGPSNRSVRLILDRHNAQAHLGVSGIATGNARDVHASPRLLKSRNKAMTRRIGLENSRLVRDWSADARRSLERT